MWKLLILGVALADMIFWSGVPAGLVFAAWYDVVRRRRNRRGMAQNYRESRKNEKKRQAEARTAANQKKERANRTGLWRAGGRAGGGLAAPVASQGPPPPTVKGPVAGAGYGKKVLG